MRSLVRNCVDVLLMAGEPATLHAMFGVIRSAPPEAACAASAEWRDASECWRLVEAARARGLGTSWEADGREVAAYWLRHFPALGERTRGSIVAMFSTLAESLMRGRMRELFCEGCTLRPEDVLAGRVVVVDLPVKEWSVVGRTAAVLWKYGLQKAVERQDRQRERPRATRSSSGPTSASISRADTTRSSRPPRARRAATVYLTQNYPTLVAALGGDAAGRSAADALIGNLGTKIFHANSDRETNQLAAELVGKRLQRLRSFGRGATLGLGGQAGAGASSNAGVGEHMDFEIQPAELAGLKKGGPDHGYATEALVFQNGRLWSATCRTWQKALFRQGLMAPGIRPDRVPDGPHARRP